jgi:hypothetical protein
MRAMMLAAVLLCCLVPVSTPTVDTQPAEEPGPAGRGCCSHHKGECGCSGGRTQCCDGTISPTCRC